MGCPHPLRSVLYTTADNARGLEKLSTLEADAFIVDLEDGVAEDHKQEARVALKAFLATWKTKGKYLTVRINTVSSGHVGEDLKALAQYPPDAVVFPKVSGKADVKKAEALMGKTGLPNAVRMWCLIETPIGVLNAGEIAAASKRLECLVMGTSDLVKDLHVTSSPAREGLTYSLSCVVLAARAYGLSVVDGVYINLRDQAGFEEVCRQGKRLGFEGKTVIHPIQIAPANQIFAPGKDEIERAKKIIAAFEAAREKGKGVVLVDGRLVEKLDVEAAERLLALAEKTAGL